MFQGCTTKMTAVAARSQELLLAAYMYLTLDRQSVSTVVIQ